VQLLPGVWRKVYRAAQIKAGIIKGVNLFVVAQQLSALPYLMLCRDKSLWTLFNNPVRNSRMMKEYKNVRSNHQALVKITELV
jgi:hypothetical protein